MKRNKTFMIFCICLSFTQLKKGNYPTQERELPNSRKGITQLMIGNYPTETKVKISHNRAVCGSNFKIFRYNFYQIIL